MTTIATMNDFDFEAFALDYVCCDYGPCELCFKKTKDAELDKYDNGLCRSCFYKTKDIREELHDSEDDDSDYPYDEPDSEDEDLKHID